MEIRTRISKKGFTLLEALVATLILTIVGSGIAGTYVIESALLRQASHRLEAINYARSCAAKLAAMGKEVEWLFSFSSDTEMWWPASSPPPELSLGVHTEASDPEICALPDSYFKNHLNGSMQYSVDRLSVLTVDGGEHGVIRVEITVEWEESFPKKRTKGETLFVVPAAYVDEA